MVHAYRMQTTCPVTHRVLTHHWETHRLGRVHVSQHHTWHSLCIIYHNEQLPTLIYWFFGSTCQHIPFNKKCHHQSTRGEGASVYAMHSVHHQALPLQQRSTQNITPCCHLNTPTEAGDKQHTNNSTFKCRNVLTQNNMQYWLCADMENFHSQSLA